MSDGFIPRCLLIALFTLCGAFFSAGETALSYCNAVRIRLMADEGDRRAARAARLLDRFDETVVALLVGVNIMHVAAAAAATVLFISALGSNNGAGLATAVMTVITFLFGETVPKNIAKANSDAWLLAVSGAVLFLSRLLAPIVFVLTKFGEGVKALFRVKPDEPSMTEDEFATIVDNVQNEGLLDENESDIIKSSIEFGDLRVRDVMTRREAIVSVPIDAPEDELRRILLEKPFSRYPVTRGSVDEVFGVLMANKCLFLLAKGEKADVTGLMDMPLTLRDDAPLTDAFQEMRRHKTHFAVVQDEDARTAGILTMDDILAEIVDEVDEIREFDAPAAKGAGA